MTKVHRRCQGDDGVTLVFALVFLTVVGLLVSVALSQAATTSVTGQRGRDTTLLHYGLDGGIDRAIQVLRADQASLTPSLCTDSTGGLQDITSIRDGIGLPLNGSLIRYSCETRGGSARQSTDPTANFGLVVLSGSADAFTTYGPVGGFPAGVACGTPPAGPSPTGGYFWIGGAVYLSGPQAPLAPPILVCEGDVNQLKSAPCTIDSISTLTTLKIGSPNHLRACTKESQLEAAPPYVPPTRPAADYDVTNCHVDFKSTGVATGPGSCNPPGGAGGASCRVFYPGHYLGQPNLLGGASNANYFVSGRYYFDGIGNWVIGASTTVIAGATVSASDQGTDVATTGCAGLAALPTGADAAAAAVAPTVPGAPVGYTAAHELDPSGGTQWVLGGSSQIDVEGTATLHSGTYLPGGLKPYTLVVVPDSGSPRAMSSYTPFTAGVGSITASGSTCNPAFAFCNGSGSETSVNGRLYAPTGAAKLFSSSPTIGVFTGGVVVDKIRLGGPAGDIAVGSPGGIPDTSDAFRTIRVRASSSGTGLQQTAIITLDNFGTFDAHVLGWKTNQ